MDRQRGTNGHVVVREDSGPGAETHYRREVLGFSYLHTKKKKEHANAIVSGVFTRRFALPERSGA